MTQETVPLADAGRNDSAERVGPNAITQYLPVLENELGATALHEFLAVSHVDSIPDGLTMIDERQAAQFHRAVRQHFPVIAADLACRAGSATADYIIANRIPAIVKWLLPLFPRPVAETMLCRAIADHAWTFAGSGAFRAKCQDSLVFEIAANPLACGERASDPICYWHAAVFRELFSRLVGGNYEATETACCACGAEACRFVISRDQ